MNGLLFLYASAVGESFGLLSREQLSRRRLRLRARIERDYQLTEEAFVVGPLQFGFTRVANPNRVLDQVCAREDDRARRAGQSIADDDLHLPYWAELWDSSIALGHFLAASELRRQRVLDLGCGMGFAGTVAAAMGHSVLLADLEPPALLFAQFNTLPYARRARTRQLNWQTDLLGEQFDLILGADVIYERSQWEYLESFWRTHLADGGQILLTEPGRQTGDLFGDWITQRRWTLHLREQPIPARKTPIRLFSLRP